MDESLLLFLCKHFTVCECFTLAHTGDQYIECQLGPHQFVVSQSRAQTYVVTRDAELVLAGQALKEVLEALACFVYAQPYRVSEQTQRVGMRVHRPVYTCNRL